MLQIEEFKEVINSDFVRSDAFLDLRSRKTTLKTMQSNIKNEPFLQEEQRLSLFPIKHHDIWNHYQKQLSSMWVPREISMETDSVDFKQFDSNTQHFIKNILAFFATADGSVMLNIAQNFMNDVTNLEAQICYQFQGAMEGIHSEVYSRLIDEIVKDHDEKTRLYEAVITVPCIREKNAWGQKWAYSGAPFVQRVVANAIVEGIFFSGSFCAIFWIKTQNKMPGLCQSNELISRDEGMHCEYAYIIYNKLLYKMDDDEIKEMVYDAVQFDKRFINDLLQCNLIGMNANLMAQYIEYVADDLLVNLGHTKLFNVQNPFGFMNALKMDIKTNFFETRTTSYQKPMTYTGPVENDDDF